jgi:N-acetylglutamate synthase-like GNAT family acetyltransferase
MTERATRPARAEDVGAIAATVSSAYLHYIERIGRQPGPMLEDYAAAVQRRQVHVVTQAGTVIGVIVMGVTDEGFCIDNVAVRPSAKGQGVGRMLLALVEAEAHRQGFDSLYLATHELMTENQALYQRIGYVPFDERVVTASPHLPVQVAHETRQCLNRLHVDASGCCRVHCGHKLSGRFEGGRHGARSASSGGNCLRWRGRLHGVRRLIA